jgi:acetyl/propionyl-CoA carboxylase alpha subunit
MHGNVVHFGTRDCSSQRRHQKLLEEAPAPFLDEDTRERIHSAAVAAAKSVGYYNAGTAEFLVQGREFYFLEINTRIQVEHPITEAVTGVDLVTLQLRVAMGEPLPMKQDQITFTGHAIELRINAEDVCEGFRPAIGTITEWKRPQSKLVREDCGYAEGDTIPPFYDSLISKIIVHAPTRSEALYRTFSYLKNYSISGVPTTIPFHAWILSNEAFQTTGIDIGYVERTFSKDGAEAALSLLAVDPEHKAVDEGSEPFVEVIQAEIAHQDGASALRIVHEPGGTFLAIPLAKSGEPLTPDTWRRSNTRAGAIKG